MIARGSILKAAVLFGLIVANYDSIPSSNIPPNANLMKFDTLIILGTPCTAQGKPSPEQRERVLEGVREFRAGVAPYIIVTGGAAHNRFPEADCMKQLALSEGVPADDVLEETQAKNTIQNIWFSSEMMKQRGWRSAEVVSSPSHLPRAALILEHYRFAWRTHAARWPAEYTKQRIAAIYWGEMKSCWQLTRHGFPRTLWLPAV